MSESIFNHCDLATWQLLTCRSSIIGSQSGLGHYDVRTWKHFLHHWPFVRAIHRSVVVPTHKRLVLQNFFYLCWSCCWTSNLIAGDLWHFNAHRTRCYGNLLLYSVKPRIFVMWTFSSLVALEVVVMTTSSATNDNQIRIVAKLKPNLALVTAGLVTITKKV